MHKFISFYPCSLLIFFNVLILMQTEEFYYFTFVTTVYASVCRIIVSSLRAEINPVTTSSQPFHFVESQAAQAQVVCHMLLRNSGHSQIIRLCIGIFTICFRKHKYYKIFNKKLYLILLPWCLTCRLCPYFPDF